ncbi:esterase [Chitinophaga agrisoli]|uniref:Esterase n=1 Tax=Chitinophaga agrisoli TaxID=2607653 RepID=A0A5B2VW07_9BACT|nr:esterase [Chitinophaga agrisoli]KAA2242778.1 esterase [Chitinophaga agrisoli]
MKSSYKYEATKGEQLILKYKLREPLTDAANPGLLVLLHGVGGNEDNMFRLAASLPEDMIIVAARAPYTLKPDSYAWFGVQFSPEGSIINAEQAEKSRTVLNLFVNQLTERFQIDKTRVYLGGFSQGGIMSYSVGLTFAPKFAGIFCLSGRLLKEVRPMIKSGPEIRDLKVFIAHGTDDRVLSVNYAREAMAYLQELGIYPEYHEYQMPHSMEQQEIDDLNRWLRCG